MAPRYNLAKRKAQQLLSQANIQSAPVPLEAVAEALGARIHYEPYDGEDMSGMAYRQPDGQRVIGVNSLHSARRQRFTIAHEMAHLLLHANEDLHVDKSFPIGFRTEKSSLAIDDKEIEANQFAAELLMPAAWILADVQARHIDFEGDDAAIQELAEKYGVSVRAMTIRLSALGALTG
jgi:Zn-dependent peptidase ImmA (M78 family)